MLIDSNVLIHARNEDAPRGTFFHDAHLAALCLEHGIRKIATTDIEFRKFPFLEVIDPTA